MATRDYHTDDRRGGGYCYRHGGSACPDCVAEDMRRLSEPEPAPTTLPPAVQAVLEAAVAWFRVRQPLDAYRLDTTPERRLALAVDAYRTTLEPQAVRPEEVPVGNLVEYASTVWRMGAFGGRRVLVSESGWRVVELSSEARVTPLPKEPE